jgi:plasmid stabilization system protein ParE
VERIVEVIWTSGASADLQRTFDWLETAEPPWGETFLEATSAAIELLKSFPGRGSKVRGSAQLRGVLLGKRREYGLYYAVTGNRLILTALIDLRQDPAAIEKILRER